MIPTKLIPRAGLWLLIITGLIPRIHAATPIPVWYGQPGSTRQGYEFITGDTHPVAEILANPYGTPVATVNLGGFSDGWQDPANPVDLSGVLQDGAWDLGTAGAIAIQLQVAENPPPPGTFFRIDFQIYAVAYRGITSLPVLQSVGLVPQDLVLTQTVVAEDPLFPGATWRGMTWTGYYTNVVSNVITVAIAAPSNNTAVVDTVEVFTRYSTIPEISSVMMVALQGIGWCLRRRRT